MSSGDEIEFYVKEIKDNNKLTLTLDKPLERNVILYDLETKVEEGTIEEMKAIIKHKLKMMGIEAVKSSTPAPCRQMIKDGLKLMMSGTEEDVINFIDRCRSEFKKMPPEQIAFPRTASDVVKYRSSSDIYVKGTPIHIRGALLFNHYVKENKLTNKYSLIANGEKIKFLYLKKPNIIQENVISFIQDFPRELNLDKYVDYDLQFEKSFVEPLKSILDAIGWSVEKTVNLELFFA